MAARARAARAVRHRADAGSGHHVRQPVVAHQLQRSQPGACRGHRARGAGAAGLVAPGAAGRPVDGRRWHGPRACRCRASCQLRRAGGRAAIRAAPRPGREAQARRRLDGARHLRPAGRSAGAGDRHFRVRPQRARRRHGPRRGRPSARAAPPRSSASTRRSVRGMPGFIKLVVRKNFVGVVCEKPWQAVQAARALKASWNARRRASAAGRLLRLHAAPAVPRHAGRRFGRRRSRPCGQPRPSCGPPTGTRTRCTGRWAPRARWPMSAGRCDDLVARRSRPIRCGIRRRCSSACRRSSVRVIFVRGSGCYGINGADTVSYDAALLSQAVGRPVRVQLSRQDEMAWENYGFAYAIDLRVGLDALGHHRRLGLRVVECGARRTPRLRHARQRRHRHARSASRRRRSRRARARRRRPSFNNGSNAAPSYVTGCAGGDVRRHGYGEERARAHAHDRVALLHGTAAIAEPAAEHLCARVVHGRTGRAGEGRSRRVPPAPPPRSAPHRRRQGGGEGRRLADAAVAATRRRRGGPASPAGAGSPCVLYEGDNGYCALVAEVEVDQRQRPHSRDATRLRPGLRADLVTRRDAEPDRGRRTAGSEPRPRRGGDLGPDARSPRWTGGRITASPWAPRSRPSRACSSTGRIKRRWARARPRSRSWPRRVGNAVFDATGARLREVPFTPERVRTALAAAPPSIR